MNRLYSYVCCCFSGQHHHGYYNYHHHHGHHHYPHVARLRPALYFFLILVLSTFLYCLVFYDQPMNGLIRSTISFHRHYSSGRIGHLKALRSDDKLKDIEDIDDDDDTSIQSEIILFDELMRQANKHFIGNFRRKILEETLEIANVVPIENSSFSSSVFSSSHEIEAKFRYETVPDDSDSSERTNSSVEEEDIGDNGGLESDRELEEEEEEESYDRNRIEHNLRILGIDLRRIIELNRHNRHNRSNTNNRIGSNNLLDSLIESNVNNNNDNQNVISTHNSHNSSSSSVAILNSSNSPIPNLQPHRQHRRHHHHHHHSYHENLPEYFLNSDSNEMNVESVTFVSAINYNQFNIGFDFIKSFEKFRTLALLLQNSNSSLNGSKILINLLIYDLGLYPSQLFEIETLCNSTSESKSQSSAYSPVFNISSAFMANLTSTGQSQTSFPVPSLLNLPLCRIRRFNYDQYPSHVSNLKIAAYRPLIIQEVLRDLKHLKFRLEKSLKKTNSISILWFDIHYRFIPSRFEKLAQLLNQTGYKSGLASWTIEQPTSSLTDPRMFDYFEASADSYYFHRMIRSGHLLLTLRDSTWAQIEWGIMLPWVRCALSADCIAPFGSQWRSICQLGKKPHYRYSGCHHYDMSALNVILGIAFNYSSSIYSAANSDRFFISVNNLLLTANTKQPEFHNNNNRLSSHYRYRQQSKDVLGKDEIVSLFQQPDSSPSIVNNRKTRASLSSRSDSEEHYRFDRILTDDDLPSELRRTSFLANPSLYESGSSILNPDLNEADINEPISAGTTR